MNNLNQHLEISPEIQAIIDAVENTKTYIAETKIAAHPKFRQYDRYIRVLSTDIKSENEFVSFGYQQILKDPATGDEMALNLPTPEWVVYNNTWSYLRGSNGQPLKLSKKDNTEETDFIKVPSFKYFIMLMRNKQARYLDLVNSYLHTFVETKLEELNKV